MMFDSTAIVTLHLGGPVWSVHGRRGVAPHLWSKFGRQLLASFIHASHFARLLFPLCSTGAL